MALKATDLTKLERREKRYEANIGGGLFVVVKPKGDFDFIFRGRRLGKSFCEKLGVVGDMTLSEAKAKADEMRVAAKKAVQGKQVPETTVEDAWRTYMSRYVETNGQSNGFEKDRIFRKEVLPQWDGKLLCEVTGDDCADIIENYFRALTKERGRKGVAANRLHSVLSHFFKWSFGQRALFRLELNPMLGIAPVGPRYKPHKRAFDDEELVLWFRAALRMEGMGNGTAVQARASQVLMRTCARSADIYTLPWGGVHEDRLHVVRTKKDNSFDFYKHPSIAALIGTKPEGAGDSDLVWGFDMDWLLKAGDKFRAVMTMIAGEEGRNVRYNDPEDAEHYFKPHDYRKAATTWLGDLDNEETEMPLIPGEVLDAVLNHFAGDLRRRTYQVQKTWRARRKALMLWNDHLDTLLAKARELEAPQALAA